VTFSAGKIPLAPLAIPSRRLQRQGEGDLIASAQIKGAGITEPVCKKPAGQVSVIFTNGNIQLVGPRQKSGSPW